MGQKRALEGQSHLSRPDLMELPQKARQPSLRPADSTTFMPWASESSMNDLGWG